MICPCQLFPNSLEGKKPTVIVKITGFLVPIPDLQKWDHRRGALESSLLISTQDDSYPQAHLGSPWPIRENPEEVKKPWFNDFHKMVSSSLFACHLPRISRVLEFIPVRSLPQSPANWSSSTQRWWVLGELFCPCHFLPRTPFHFVPLLDLDSEATDLQVISNYSEMAFQCK